MSDNPIVTMRGNLVDDPELRFTPSGTQVCSFRMAVTHWRGANKDDESSFWNVNVWRDQAENVAESLHKGLRVVVVGELRERNYEGSDGKKVYVKEIEADDVAPSMKWARATVTRAPSAGQAPSKPGNPAATTADDDTDVPF